MSSPLLEARGLGKQYPRTGLRRRADVWSLRGVDVDVGVGEVVAVLGRNGAGKSTLLKLAAGVTRPTEGTLRRVRRVAPLIEVGAGFHPEMTGRQNVGLNGRLLGLTRREVARLFDEIVEFSELGAAVDDPVKTYSSGMYMRLGFSVAVHTNPALLLVDEVLSVGDLPFQVKCLDRIRALREQGTGILFVSHNLAAVQSLADRALLLERGRPTAEGDVRQVVGRYYETMALDARAGEIGDDGAAPRALRVVEATVRDAAGGEPDLWDPGSRAVVRVVVEATADVGPLVAGATLHKEGAGMVGSWLGADAPRLPGLRAGERRTVALSVDLNVVGGQYVLDVGLASDDLAVLHTAEPVARFAVGHEPGQSGLVHFAPRLLDEAP